MSEALFSIVIPVYNGANYLREAIDSALAQTAPRVEVLVVNDGSTDGGQTEAIARSYGARIRYFHKPNGGVATALNLGIQNMRGEWFAWLSHDDLFGPTRIANDRRVIENNPDARVIFCRHASIDEHGKLIAEHACPLERITNVRQVLIYNCADMCSITVHRSCFEKTGPFNEQNHTTQDVEMSLLLAKYYQFYANPDAITYRRDHPHSGTRTLSAQHRKDLLLLCERIHASFALADFFPEVAGGDPRQVAEAWRWMGNLYLGWGAYAYADESYRRAFRAEKKVLSSTALKCVLGAKNYDSALSRSVRSLARAIRGVRQ